MLVCPIPGERVIGKGDRTFPGGSSAGVGNEGDGAGAGDSAGEVGVGAGLFR